MIEIVLKLIIYGAKLAIACCTVLISFGTGVFIWGLLTDTDFLDSDLGKYNSSMSLRCFYPY